MTVKATILRTFFIYAVITFIPFSPSFYQQDFDAGFTVNAYPWRWLDVVSQNNPWFFSSQGGKNYLGWFLTLLASFAAGVIWAFIDDRRKKRAAAESNTDTDAGLYNWFFILVRYQIVLRMSWFAIAKVFPVQMPFPTISQLNTNLGDFTPGKLYWLTTGVSPFFEVFAGIFELVATILLLSRRTTTLGSLMMIAILLPIWFVNIGYDAGVELASLHILLLSVLLLAKNFGRFWELLVLHKQAALIYIKPAVYAEKWQRVSRFALKVVFVFLFLILRGYEYGNLYADGKTFKLPLDNGDQSFTGFYHVSEYRLNGKDIPYSPLDSLRWQNVIFEKFNTISIRIAKPFVLNTQNKIRTTEYYGNIGRSFYGYQIDTVKHIFLLKNRADTASQLILSYKRKDKEIILSGLTENKDSVYAVLNKIEKAYPLAKKRTSSGD
jgi:hypothetical protein